MAYYWDSSAITKLIVAEAESDALRAWHDTTESRMVSSDLSRTEVMRAARRADSGRATKVNEVLGSLYLLKIPTSVFEAAGRLAPATVRSLDAIHIAAALTLEDELEGIVCYDDRLAEAARTNGIAVVAPAPPVPTTSDDD